MIILLTFKSVNLSFCDMGHSFEQLQSRFESTKMLYREREGKVAFAQSFSQLKENVYVHNSLKVSSLSCGILSGCT